MRICRIMVVDDRGIDSAKLRACLAVDHWDILVAESKKSVIPIANEVPPEVLVLGATRDRFAGCDLCRRLKQELPLVDVLVIVCVADIHDLEEVVAAGAADFASSPLNEGEVRRRVDNLLAQRI